MYSEMARGIATALKIISLNEEEYGSSQKTKLQEGKGLLYCIIYTNIKMRVTFWPRLILELGQFFIIS